MYTHTHVSMATIAVTATTPCIRVPMDPRHIPTMAHALDGHLAEARSVACIPIHYETPPDGNAAQKRIWIYEYCCLASMPFYKITPEGSNAYYVIKVARHRNSDKRVLMYPSHLDAIRLADLGVFDNPPFLRIPGL